MRNNADPGRQVTLARVTQAALVVAAVCFLYEQAIITRSVVPPLVVFLVVDLLIAGLIARGWRRAPLAGAIWMALVVLFSISVILGDLSNPAALHQFLWQAITTLTHIVGIVAGIAATLTSHRPTDSNSSASS